MPSNFQHITIEDDGRVLAEADVRAEPDVVRASLRVEAGHLPPGTRARLVDAVLAIPDAQPGTRLVVTRPAGDAEILERIRTSAAWRSGHPAAQQAAPASGARCPDEASSLVR